MNHEFQFLSFQDFKHFNEKFAEYAGYNADSIPFDCLREITYTFNKFNRQTAIEYLDNFLKRTKAVNRLKESELLVCKFYLNLAKYDYFHFLDTLSMEHDRVVNENDPELSKFVNFI
jgi:hypothetical protein